MRTYRWWLKQKRRVQKKYTLFLGRYYSPLETKSLVKRIKNNMRDKKRSEDGEAD